MRMTIKLAQSLETTHVPWDVGKSHDLYRLNDWGGGYFDINDKGHVVVRPSRSNKGCDLYQLTRSLELRGIDAPILFRFDEILDDRRRTIQEAFDNAIKEWNYQGNYRIAFPLKVNPQGHVVDRIRKGLDGAPLYLEVGSKPELLAVLSLESDSDSIVLCNGYKDAEYIELALMGRKLGFRTIIILEQPYELEYVLKIAEQLSVEAELGVRIKPITRGEGLWSSSAGEKAKFGLTTQQLLVTVNQLKQAEKAHWLRLLHFHVGSQIPSIISYRKVLKEASRMFVEVARLCPSLSFLDVGGGLGVDYDGSHSNFESSMNYSVGEYAEVIVSHIHEACERAGVDHPDIISESGRALVAHHAILVTEVIDVSLGSNGVYPVTDCPSDQEVLIRINELFEEVTVKNLNQTLNEVVGLKEEVLELFMQGRLTLEERAFAEHTLKGLSMKIVSLSSQLRNPPEAVEKLEDSLRDMFFCNFSLFQSALDSWAIDQLFPIIPLQRLTEKPSRRATLADLTCDSDGEVSRFIDLKDVKNYLPCHLPHADEPYYLGIFLVGAYQEILGGLHNLFGDTNVVHVSVPQDGEFEFTEVIHGDTVREVLDYVEYETPRLATQFRQTLERGIRSGNISAEESAYIQKRYKELMDGYTYLVK
jgi:arginine decarboxylase